MADSKSSLNLGGSRIGGVVAGIKSEIADVRQQFGLWKQDAISLENVISRIKSSLGSIRMPSMGGGDGGVSPNQVATDPQFTPPAGYSVNSAGQVTQLQGGALAVQGGSNAVATTGSGNNVFYTPSTSSSTSTSTSTTGGGWGGARNLTEWVKDNPGAAALFAASTVGGMLPSAAESVESELLMSRTAFVNEGLGANLKERYAGANKLQGEMALSGTVIDKMDTMRALAAAQSMGITGPNITQAGGGMGSVAMGAAYASNLVPGMTVEGTMRAYGSMQKARNVNMLRGIGINIRDEQGNMKPPNEIIDDLWTKIVRDYSRAYGKDAYPSEREVLIGLQPGNSMDSMLEMYFGNDPMAKQMVANGLIYKAKTKGAKIDDKTKGLMTGMGGTTEATNAFSKRQATAAIGQGMVASFGAEGFENAAQILTKLGEIMNKLGPVLGGAVYASNFAETMAGAGGGVIGKVLELIMGIKPKAKGGPVSDSKPYLVGEKGPEIFVPKEDGTIIPNHELKGKPFGGFRHAGGGVIANHAYVVGEKGQEGYISNKRQWAEKMLERMGAPKNADSVEALLAWQAEEGGHWRNTAGYNPLNTTYEMPGSFKMKGKGGKVGVQHFTSWDQGIEATYKTLTTGSSKSRGYDAIVTAFKNGAPKEELLKAIAGSSWVGANGATAKAYETFGVSAPTVETPVTEAPTSTLTDAENALAQAIVDAITANSSAKEIKSLQDFISGKGSPDKLTGSGGITININGAQDAKAIVAELKKFLTDNDLLTKVKNN
jgi:hypothetical protein